MTEHVKYGHCALLIVMVAIYANLNGCCFLKRVKGNTVINGDKLSFKSIAIVTLWSALLSVVKYPSRYFIYEACMPAT